jgi:hypothetical protein
MSLDNSGQPEFIKNPQHIVVSNGEALLIENASGTNIFVVDSSANSVKSYGPPITAKTSSYTVLATDSGTFFTTEGASGAVTFTLPAVGTTHFHAWFFCAEDQTMTVASAAGDDMVLFNDVAADSLAFSTSSEKAGGGCYCISDGTKWMVLVNLAIETQTPVVAT